VELIKKYFADFTPMQVLQMAQLQDLYTEWNEKINVISRKDIDALYERHVLHSLSIATIFNFKDEASILDLGCGGGFPSVPLAIMFPNVQFLCVDSVGKKLTVINAVAEALQLKNITTKHSRVEEIKGQKFDYVISRAVAKLGTIWQWSKPLLKKNDTSKVITDFTQKHSLVCLKGGDLTQEISESGTKPHVWELSGMFEEEFFKEKFLLQVF
jgi:16S rRNA (guanine527-N7)-methyltransferase